MDRELLLVCLVALAGPPLTCAGAMFVGLPVPQACAGAWERGAWRRLWAPLLFPAFANALLLGWVLREPPNAEALPPLLFVIVVPSLLILFRALRRAARSACAQPAPNGAAAVGLLQPRVFISDALASVLTPAERSAVIAHECSHCAHRDPFRILCAQMAADLQWPIQGADRRMRAWNNALECSRDEEARRHGIDGADLASAVLAAVRLAPASPSRAASLTGAELAERIARLLRPLPDAEGRPAGHALHVLTAALLAAVALIGANYGEPILRAVLLR